MKPDVMHSIAKIIAEIHTSIYIDKFDEIFIKDILQDELKAYYVELEDYYTEEYHNATNRARNIAYDVGYDDGYSDGRSAV